MVGLGPVPILLVEDDEDSREILSMMLELRLPQATLLVAEDGHVALESFKKHRPAVVVTDLNMPVMSGIRLITEINAIQSGVKYILLTAFSDHAALESCRSAGIEVHHCLTKPIDYRKLVAAIQQCLPQLAEAPRPAP